MCAKAPAMQRTMTAQIAMIRGKLTILVPGEAPPLYRGSRLDRPGAARQPDGGRIQDLP